MNIPKHLMEAKEAARKRHEEENQRKVLEKLKKEDEVTKIKKKIADIFEKAVRKDISKDMHPFLTFPSYEEFTVLVTGTICVYQAELVFDDHDPIYINCTVNCSNGHNYTANCEDLFSVYTPTLEFNKDTSWYIYNSRNPGVKEIGEAMFLAEKAFKTRQKLQKEAEEKNAVLKKELLKKQKQAKLKNKIEKEVQKRLAEILLRLYDKIVE